VSRTSLKNRFVALAGLSLLALVVCSLNSLSFGVQANGQAESFQYQYPFQNPEFPVEERINNIVSSMTLDEKIACLGTDPSVPRLGIRGSRHVEGIHGLAQRGPANWRPPRIVPTTIFPQGIGMAETWDVEMLRQAGAIEG